MRDDGGCGAVGIEEEDWSRRRLKRCGMDGTEEEEGAVRRQCRMVGASGAAA